MGRGFGKCSDTVGFGGEIWAVRVSPTVQCARPVPRSCLPCWAGPQLSSQSSSACWSCVSSLIRPGPSHCFLYIVSLVVKGNNQTVFT